MSDPAPKPACPFCPPSQRVYLSSPRWNLLRHLDPVPLAGWMMIATREHRAGAHELDATEQFELGVILAAVASAVRAEIGCERTYTISFNEAVPHLHVHVIPRHASDPSTTSWALADRYRATARREADAANPADAERVAEAVAARALRELGGLGFALPASNG
jgi:diadenosine tetraphosphate (Ap4A) HIT family hydrolase